MNKTAFIDGYMHKDANAYIGEGDNKQYYGNRGVVQRRKPEVKEDNPWEDRAPQLKKRETTGSRMPSRDWFTQAALWKFYTGEDPFDYYKPEPQRTSGFFQDSQSMRDSVSK